jgi:small subunit ribosomal protein S5
LIAVSIGNWEPRTELGRKVKSGEITNIDDILKAGNRILESEIVDMLLPDIKTETVKISTTQRVTDSGRRMSFKAIVLVGDGNGHIGLGVGKAAETGPAIDYATRSAKKKLMYVPRGCGSWECRCGGNHSIPFGTRGKQSSTMVELKPAPRGLGLAVNDNIKTVASLLGIKDIWGQARGSTDNVYNSLVATLKALKKIEKGAGQ